MPSTATNILEQYWGYPAFRGKQEQIIDSVLAGQDTFAIMATGGGKSLCYQVPAMQKAGICLVVSPLISLMKDQVAQLKERNIKAVYISSGMSMREVDYALNNCIFGGYKFLYVSPERLSNDVFITRVQEMNVNLIAVDEAHCISQWGYDFRPSYMQIAALREYFPEINILALTATATPEVKKDVVEKLELKEPAIIEASLLRDNMSLQVRHAPDKIQKIREILDYVKGTGIIYTMSRRHSKSLCDALQAEGYSATYYHAGLKYRTRMQFQNEWMSGKKDVIVATSAFGMGINKANVRYVIHADVPESLEAYYQEAGRAGRDGRNAFAILLFNEKDKERLESSKEDKFPAIEKVKEVLVSLFNYFQIAVGTGTGRPYAFEVRKFAHKFNYESNVAINAVLSLVREEWLTLTESFYLPSRIHFSVRNNEVYQFLIKHENLAPLVKNILRAYGGVFEQYVKLDEERLAKNLAIPLETLQEQLTQLHNLGIAKYYGQTDTPQLSFLRERPLNDLVHISKKNIDFLRERHIKRIETVLQYIEAEDNCRFNYIRNYFGDVVVDDCGVCDYCLKKKHSQTQVNEAELEAHILQMLAANGYKEKAIFKACKGIALEKVKEVLAYLERENKIEFKKGIWKLADI